MLTNDAGETTRQVWLMLSPLELFLTLLLACSHLMGFFYRTIRMVEHGIKPAHVFDGKPPDLKSGVVRYLLARDHCKNPIFLPVVVKTI